MFAWSQLDFLVIPVSISAVSLTGRQTWQNVICKRRCKEFKMYMKGKDIRKKRHLADFVFVPSVLGRSFQQLNFEWYRQKPLAGKSNENSQMFIEDFYLPLWRERASQVPFCVPASLPTTPSPPPPPIPFLPSLHSSPSSLPPPSSLPLPSLPFSKIPLHGDQWHSAAVFYLHNWTVKGCHGSGHSHFPPLLWESNLYHRGITCTLYIVQYTTILLVGR